MLNDAPVSVPAECGGRSSGYKSQQSSRVLGGVASLRAQFFEELRVGERTRERGRRGAQRGLSLLPQGGIVCSSSLNPPPYIGGAGGGWPSLERGAAGPRWVPRPKNLNPSRPGTLSMWGVGRLPIRLPFEMGPLKVGCLLLFNRILN
jgi:hypothetical protein